MSVDDASADGSRGCCQPSDALAMCYGLWPWKRLHCSVVAMAMCWGEAGREEGGGRGGRSGARERPALPVPTVRRIHKHSLEERGLRGYPVTSTNFLK